MTTQRSITFTLQQRRETPSGTIVETPTVTCASAPAGYTCAVGGGAAARESRSVVDGYTRAELRGLRGIESVTGVDGARTPTPR